MKRLVALIVLILVMVVENGVMNGDTCYVTFVGVGDKLPGDYSCSGAWHASLAAGLGVVIILGSYAVSALSFLSKRESKKKKL